jgi:hypothetical protein
MQWEAHHAQPTFLSIFNDLKKDAKRQNRFCPFFCCHTLLGQRDVKIGRAVVGLKRIETVVTEITSHRDGCGV